MSQTKTEIRALLDAADARPKHRFGQNFMIDRNLVAAVADAGGVAPGDTVIEVGPGTGTLTEELLARAGGGGRVVAVEIDRGLAEMLRGRFADATAAGRFELIEGDALAGKHGLHPELAAVVAQAVAAGRPARLVANLPYNIASPLVVELLAAGVERLAFTVQREVADRMRAAAGADDYGPLTVMVQLLAGVEVLRTLPPQAFWPAPTIDSALVRLTRDDRIAPRAVGDVGGFVRRLFSMRRKTLRKALREMSADDADGLLTSRSLDGQARPETLTPGQVLELFDAMTPLRADR